MPLESQHNTDTANTDAACHIICSAHGSAHGKWDTTRVVQRSLLPCGCSTAAACQTTHAHGVCGCFRSLHMQHIVLTTRKKMMPIATVAHLDQPLSKGRNGEICHTRVPWQRLLVSTIASTTMPHAQTPQCPYSTLQHQEQNRTEQTAQETPLGLCWLLIQLHWQDDQWLHKCKHDSCQRFLQTAFKMTQCWFQ
jgi:hypothetical protein